MSLQNQDNLDWIDQFKNIPFSEGDSEAEKEVSALDRLEQARATEHEQRNEKRYRYANTFTWIAIGWIVFVGAVILLKGFGGYQEYSFEISDGIVMMMLGTAMVNVLTPAYLLARYLFNIQS